MNSNCKYEVQTHWGWFRLDEGAYRDYLAGKLWICWVPGKRPEPYTDPTALPVTVGKAAKALMERAEWLGVIPVAKECCPTLEVPIPCKARMEDLGIEELPLSVRASNGLRRAGIHTYGQLKKVTGSESGLLTIRNLGMKSVLEIRAAFLGECYHRLLPVEKAEFWQRVQEAI